MSQKVQLKHCILLSSLSEAAVDGRDVPEDVSERGLWQMNSARLKLGGGHIRLQ